MNTKSVQNSLKTKKSTLKTFYKSLDDYALALFKAVFDVSEILILICCLKGPSINNVTALGRRGYQGFCDNNTKALLNKSGTMGEGCQK
jgi:hypothetical protein